MVYALDTNIIIHYLKNTPNVVQNLYDAIMRGDDLIIPQIVDYEIKRGFRIFSAPKKEASYKIFTEEIYCNVAEIDINSWERAEKVYADLYNKRLTIGELDILIAAFCLENNYTLVTENIKHFKDINELSYVNWNE